MNLLDAVRRAALFARTAMAKHRKPKSGAYRVATELVLAGRDPLAHAGFVNTPIYRGSTVLASSAAEFLGQTGRYRYGRIATPTTDALAEAMQQLEGGTGVVLTPSGLSAVTIALLASVKSGEHVLVADTVYGPTRRFCDSVLTAAGVKVSYYDPTIGAAIANEFRPNTRAVFLEAPGSLSFEMQDVPAITAVARARNAVTLMDNTWATPIFFRPHAHGVDLSIQAGTKYIGGHADANIGIVSATAETFPHLMATHTALGLAAGPEDVFLALRGLRTLAVRLDRHMASGLKVARWLKDRPEVSRVLHPALEDDPGHAIWKRDFTGACGLFSIVLRAASRQAVAAFLEGLELFGIGASWGGYESLAIPFDCSNVRTATRWNPGGPTVRLHIGLEDPDDLIADLEAGLSRLKP